MKIDEIICGDNVEVMQGFPDACVDLVFTSPPYPGVNNMWGDLFKADNVEMAHKYLYKVWDECLRVLKPGCKLIINIANTKLRPYIPNVSYTYWWAKGKIEPVGEIIWNKGYGQNGTAWGSFRSPSDPALADQHEYILVFRKYGERARPDEFEKMSIHDFKSWRNTMWNIAPAKASEVGHVAPFPQTIPNRIIQMYSFENEVVLDPFMGSGTTAMAAKEFNRHYVGIDISEEYCKLARNRVQGANVPLFVE